MCGRFAFFSPKESIAAAFHIPSVPHFRPRYNIAPSQEVFAIRADGNDIVADTFRWGLVPFWAKDPALGSRLINARAETVAEKPSYRQALIRRRCLILANGFFEWQKTESGKQPWFIESADAGLLAFAGLWEDWRRGEEQFRTCTIITTTANLFMQKLHHRMPVILGPESRNQWLNRKTTRLELDGLLANSGDTPLHASIVSRRVNSPVNDDPELLQGEPGPV